MGQSPDETAGLVDAPSLSVDGDPVSIFFIGFWIHRDDSLLGPKPGLLHSLRGERRSSSGR
jgi:hypothetical protein